jgi:hypothetical protein
MKKLIFLVFAVSVVMFSGCSGSKPKPDGNIVDGEVVNEMKVEKSNEYYEAIGMGAPSDGATTKAAKRQTSYEAGKAAALNDIASYLYGVKLESGMTVEDAMAKESTIRTEVAAYIRGAEITKREWDDEDSAIVTMRINMKEFKQKLKQLGVK